MNRALGSKLRRRRALLIVDVQAPFITRRTRQVLPKIRALLRGSTYDAYVLCTFHAPAGSVWDLQCHWRCEEGAVPDEIRALLPASTVSVRKTTKSAWRGVPDVERYLKRRRIQEVHIVGFDTNDCVMASAFEGFDRGFVTYVIEDCVASSDDDRLHGYALAILRNVNLTLTVRQLQARRRSHALRRGSRLRTH